MFSFKTLRHSKAARNAFAAYFAFFSSAVSGFLSIPVAVKFLDREEIGLWAAVNAMLSYLLWIDLGIGNATGRMMANAVVTKNQDEINSWWTLTQISLWALGLLVMLVGIISAPIFITIFKVPPHLTTDAWLLLGVSAFFAGVNFPMRAAPGLLTAQERFHWVSICQGTMPWLQLGGFYFMVSRGHGLTSYLWGTATSQFFVFIYYRILILTGDQKPCWTKKGLDKTRLKTLFRYSLNLSVAGLKESILQSIPTLILARHGGLGTVPLYTITGRAPLMSASLVRRTSNAFYPALVNLFVANKRDQFLNKHKFTAMLTLTVATCASVCILLFNQVFVQLIAGVDFFAGPYANIWFAITIIIISTSTLHSCLMQISGDMKKTPLVSVLSLLASYVAAIFALKWFGVAGIAAVFALEPIVYGIYGFTQGSKTMGFQIREFSTRTLMAAVVACLLIAITGIAMTHVPQGSWSITLWGRSTVLPSLEQWSIAVFIIIITCSIGLYSLKKLNSK